jgi:hypothetical protein
MKQEHQEDDGEDKRLSVKQKDGREFVDGRVAKNVSIRKQKREVRLASSRAYKEKDGEDDAFDENAPFAKFAAQDLNGACKKCFDCIAQTDKPDIVESGLRYLRYLTHAPHCQPVFPDVYRIFPAQKLMELLCVVLKTKEASLQGHVKQAAQCVSQMAQAQKAGALEFQWSNAIVHAKLIEVMSVHILHNPDMSVRTHMLHAAIHFADRSPQNAKDAALGPVMRQLLRQKLPQTYEYITWYVCSICTIRATLDWNEMVGNELWALVVHVLKTAVNDHQDTVMIEDVTVSLANVVKKGDIFPRTCKEVGSKADTRSVSAFDVSYF